MGLFYKALMPSEVKLLNPIITIFVEIKGMVPDGRTSNGTTQLNEVKIKLQCVIKKLNKFNTILKIKIGT